MMKVSLKIPDKTSGVVTGYICGFDMTRVPNTGADWVCVKVESVPENREGYVKTLILDPESGKLSAMYDKMLLSDEDYSKKVVELVRERYTLDNEIALIRQMQNPAKKAEFEEYYNYVEDCKNRAKQ